MFGQTFKNDKIGTSIFYDNNIDPINNRDMKNNYHDGRHTSQSLVSNTGEIY